MDIPAAINVDVATAARVAVALGSLVLVGRHFLRRTPKLSSGTQGSRGPMESPSKLAALEAQLRNAILSPGARERLVADAMRRTGNDRVAAIQKVLEDLRRDNMR